MNSVTTRSIGRRLHSGIGFITLPSDKDSNLFIQRCFNSGSVSMTLEDGGVVDNVLITKSALREIEFPDNKNEIGSMVVWVKKPRNNQPMIIGVFTKDNELVSFNRYSSSLKKKSSFVG